MTQEVKNMKLDIDKLKQQLELLLKDYPELAEDEELRENMFEGSTNIKEVLSELINIDANASTMIEAIKQQINHLKQRSDRFDHRKEVTRKLIMQIMNIADLTKMELANGTISVSNTPASVIITDETKIPDEYFRIKKEVNKTKLKDALKDGAIIEGAQLSNGGSTIRIK